MRGLLVNHLIRAQTCLPRVLLGRGFICGASQRLKDQLTTPGAGVAKGGGSGGTIRESGGAFGEREAALEEKYFRDLTSSQLENLKDHHLEEISHVEKDIQIAEEKLKRHKMKLDSLKKMTSHLK